jgi:CheY-like chemotaxis protein
VPHPCSDVLVVNDDPEIIEAVADALRAEGSNVRTAVGAKDALALLGAGFEPGVILTDLMMPAMSGEEFIEELRRNPQTHDIPVVAMSASPMELARLDRPDARLWKPFTLETLYRTLASLCE